MSRVRRKAGTKEALMALAPPLIKNPEIMKGKWSTYFQNTNPIHIELGMGRGTFITTLAQKNSQINYIGLELREEVLLTGIRKAQSHNLANLTFIWRNAE